MLGLVISELSNLQVSSILHKIKRDLSIWGWHSSISTRNDSWRHYTIESNLSQFSCRHLWWNSWWGNMEVHQKSIRSSAPKPSVAFPPASTSWRWVHTCLAFSQLSGQSRCAFVWRFFFQPTNPLQVVRLRMHREFNSQIGLNLFLVALL